MRRFAWTVPFAIIALAACGDAGEDAGETAEPAAQEEAAAPASTASALACAPTVDAAELAERASPYDSVTVSVGEGNAKICYSRPQLRGRTMIGGEAVPYGQLWRFGANEPTIIHLDVPATIAGMAVEPGSYSLYAVPAETGDWTLIVNRSISQWGHESQYTAEIEAQEVGRASVPAEMVEEPIESFTMRPADDGSGVVAEWQNSRIRIPIEPAG